eukprot:TRINITY_DN3563_c0_g1_i1.p1 TRINITY_DN3563_c0_g1~~TRINITY_DN3563_c0_g1_i1.p1  ORF type:complete len:399 (-),score=89.31 TRINITY_DN3563_c0_g1_i1:22-1218(-)
MNNRRSKRQKMEKNDLTPLSNRYIGTPGKLGSNGKDQIEDLKRYWIKSNERNGSKGRHGMIFFVKSIDGSIFVVKKQKVEKPEDPKDKAYVELLISQELSRLPCDNFIRLKDWWKIRDQDRDDSQSMFYVMTAGNKPLSCYKSLSAEEFRNVLFQVLFSLFIAKKNLDFQHNDLHGGNILLKEAEDEEVVQHSDGNGSVWFTKGKKALIIDFGSSFIRIIRKLKDGTECAEEIGDYENIHKSNMNGDIQTLGQVFSSSRIKISNIKQQSESVQSNLRSIRKYLSQGEHTLNQLLQHSFFNELKILPSLEEPKLFLLNPYETPLKVQIPSNNSPQSRTFKRTYENVSNGSTLLSPNLVREISFSPFSSSKENNQNPQLLNNSPFKSQRAKKENEIKIEI